MQPPNFSANDGGATTMPMPDNLPGSHHVSDSRGKKALYGAIVDWRIEEEHRQALALAGHRRLNCVPVLLSLLLPWCAFLAAFGAVSFYPHYAFPLTTWFCLILALAGCMRLVQQGRMNYLRRTEWFYWVYLGFAMALGIVFGTYYGDNNFWTWMQPVFDLKHMASYNNVNPSSLTLWNGQILPTSGRRFQDAGTIYFDGKAELDVSKAMAFKMGGLYCVAPIVDPKCERNCGYDFWAVGMNCCAEDATDFRCGDYNKPSAKSGLRLMDEAQRPYYRLAVLEAEGSHKIVSKHPVFYHWVQDPLKELAGWSREGYKRFIVAQFAGFVGNAVLFAFTFKLFNVAGNMPMTIHHGP
eukprot:TRINITY_DN90260_c0_g1_i1.p1 TRINITY_DN90260_c0_g1~~TRINITY_DN90260_c0_g1_i1.p1  ORF type:complete len:354 (-),score=84.51 TRINITY_DN90260_c0_g1_i1:66-1127(-)